MISLIKLWRVCLFTNNTLPPDIYKAILAESLIRIEKGRLAKRFSLILSDISHLKSETCTI